MVFSAIPKIVKRARLKWPFLDNLFEKSSVGKTEETFQFFKVKLYGFFHDDMIVFSLIVFECRTFYSFGYIPDWPAFYD